MKSLSCFCLSVLGPVLGPLLMAHPALAADLAPDLDGDGQGDAVQTLSWEGPPVLTAILSVSGKHMALMHMRTTGPKPDLSVAAPGTYHRICAGEGPDGDTCEPGPLELKNEGVIAQYPGKPTVLLYLEGEEVKQATVGE